LLGLLPLPQPPMMPVPAQQEDGE